MLKAWAKRPSPAMIVALIALFAALGGSAYAAKKVGTKEIKANAITTGKIKKYAITTAKIKKEAVTGAKINESPLGAVPSATRCDDRRQRGARYDCDELQSLFHVWNRQGLAGQSRLC